MWDIAILYVKMSSTRDKDGHKKTIMNDDDGSHYVSRFGYKCRKFTLSGLLEVTICTIAFSLKSNHTKQKFIRRLIYKCIVLYKTTSILLMQVISHYQNNTLLTCICSIWPNDNISIIIYLLKKQHSFEKEEKGNVWKWQIYYTPKEFFGVSFSSLSLLHPIWFSIQVEENAMQRGQKWVLWFYQMAPIPNYSFTRKWM